MISAVYVYRADSEHELYPYEPVDPYGLSQYTRNPPPRHLPPGRIRNFDLDNIGPERRARIRIREAIAVGDDRESQILRVDIMEPPIIERSTHASLIVDGKTEEGIRKSPITRTLVPKVYDAEFRPSDWGAPWSNVEQADGEFAREHGAYKYCYEQGRTGGQHLLPEFFGGWAMVVDDGPGKTRQVGLTLMEDIRGFSVENLCYREVTEKWEGPLEPTDRPVGFLKSDNESIYMDIDLAFRKDVMKRALDGIVNNLHIGVEHRDFEPANLFITMRNVHNDETKLRVVLLDHTFTQVWSKTTYAATNGERYCHQALPYPAHPYFRFGILAMDRYVGWYPMDYDDDKEFDEWLLSDEVFGPLREARDEMSELRATRMAWVSALRKTGDVAEEKLRGDVKWPHEYPKYSMFSTLDEIQEMRRKGLSAVFNRLRQMRLGSEERTKEGLKAEKQSAENLREMGDAMRALQQKQRQMDEQVLERALIARLKKLP
ncbi:hypothetical protein CkaCkLH20_00187 [Colletotrichum karsti]|uniref:Protein kinase domain-containing protein n=1 Tax=Colletotrichum karsti TaxID=1095194 RepID=A0A9P6LQU0_9PEZI|nr:uncharacterized protein CkaCkLH20_00187 [Colletotrichum karsti]KAF9882151.1 hypothetical protein CkaCkLH20_00187 [Colletotrichum karsti]